MMPDKDYTQEKIIEWWKRCSSNMACHNCPLESDCLVSMHEEDSEEFFQRIALRAAELLNDALEREKQRKWISVEEWMPENDGSLSLYDDGRLRCTSVLSYSKMQGIGIVNRLLVRKTGIPFFDEQATDGWIWSYGRDPTHWMPLPEPPEEVTQDA